MKLEDFKLYLDKMLDYKEESIKNLCNEIKGKIEALNDINIRELKVIEDILDSKSKSLNSCEISSLEGSEEKINDLEKVLKEIVEEFKRLEYLKILGKENTVIVGGNGSGKSSLVSFLKDSDSENIIVIPAQKIMFFRGSGIVTRDKIQEGQKKNLNKKSFNALYEINNRINEISDLFTNHIVAAVNSHVKVSLEYYASEQENKKESVYTKLCGIWEKLYGDIKFKIDHYNLCIIPVKKGEEYNINYMSEGEKVVILYILIVLFAPRESYIIIDEPETFLNSSIYNRLWNLLENERDDCTFIYVSHNINFINSRNVEYYYWCKKYNGNFSWEIIEILNSLENNIPKPLMMELIGATKPVLFCEGDKNSLDYKVYNSLFENKIIVMPVGGHKKVIEYTMAYNSLNFFTNKAFGIIDKDFHSFEKLEKLKKNNIYHLQVNEIESLLIVEDVLDCVLNDDYPDEKESLKNAFVNSCMDNIESKREEILRNFIKYLVDERMNEIDTTKIKKDFSITDIRHYYNEILNDKKIDEKIEEIEVKLTRIFKERKYEEYLEYASFKTLTYQLANKIFNLDYRKISSNKIKFNESLREKLREKYFQDLTNELNRITC